MSLNLGPPSIVIEVHGLRFSRERVEQVKAGRRRFSIARTAMKDARIVDDAPRESRRGHTLVAAAALVTAFYFAFVSSASPWVRVPAALVATLLLVMVSRVVMRRATLLRLRTERGEVELPFEQRLSAAEAQALMRRLRDELAWPVRLTDRATAPRG